MRALVALIALGAAASCLCAIPTAAAIEREHHVGADVGPNLLFVGSQSLYGLSAGGHWTYGLNDMFNLMAEATWSLTGPGETTNAKTPHTHPRWIGNADVGIGYVFDVLQWVPYAGVLLGGYTLSGGTVGPIKPFLGVELALGLDYRLSRSWSAGIALRQHMMSDPSTYPFVFTRSFSTYPSFSQAFARIEYTWGW